MKFVTGRLSTWIRGSSGSSESRSTAISGLPSLSTSSPDGAGSYDAQTSTHLRSGWLTFTSPRTELPGTQSLASSSSRQPSLIASPSVTSLATLNASWS